MEQLEKWTQTRTQNLQQTWTILSRSYQTRTLPVWDDFTASMLWTSAALILLPNLLVILAKRKSRKLLLDSLESILAVALVIVLLGIVLGLPVGAVYLMAKGAIYFVHSLLKLPAVASMLQSALNRSAASLEQPL
ncbi:hypothetical protein CVIRNUC_005872 [Coccomyxa viridis]|uniref:Uncharacterized protein n=1 Tax=Coccomyxa viridis TaxID=1274662 RepID=A0AAV1I7F5_9CHLO|nr:hypothetical protein CVIRNUC_005872 [Coccomyxa viridis]